MDKIFISGYNYGSYDDYTEVRLRAFPTMEEAVEFNAKHEAEYNRDVELSAKVSSGMQEWRTANPHPVHELPKVKMPQWSGKKGSKKTAPPEVLNEFKAREAEARAEYERVGQINADRQDEWNALALAETKRLMAEAGYTPEEIAAQQGAIWHNYYYDERSYEAEELPFGTEK